MIKIKRRLYKIKYVVHHKLSFLFVEAVLRKKITLRGLLHDMDKLILLFLPIKYSTIKKYHRKRSGHHFNDKIKSEKDYIYMVIDWECARFTKPDKQLTARQTLEQHFPEKYNELEPILLKLNL